MRCSLMSTTGPTESKNRGPWGALRRFGGHRRHQPDLQISPGGGNRSSRPTVTALFATGFPTGHFRHFNPGRLGTDDIGGGAYAFTTGPNVSKYLKPFVFYGNLWYTMQTDNTTVGVDADDNPIHNRNHPRDYVTVNLAAEYPITKKWVALVELTSHLGWRAPVRSQGQPGAHRPPLSFAGNRVYGHGQILPGPGSSN